MAPPRVRGDLIKALQTFPFAGTGMAGLPAGSRAWSRCHALLLRSGMACLSCSAIPAGPSFDDHAREAIPGDRGEGARQNRSVRTRVVDTCPGPVEVASPRGE